MFCDIGSPGRVVGQISCGRCRRSTVNLRFHCLNCSARIYVLPSYRASMAVLVNLSLVQSKIIFLVQESVSIEFILTIPTRTAI